MDVAEEVSVLVYDVDMVVLTVIRQDVTLAVCGVNDSRGVEGGPVYLKRSLPATLTTTKALSKESTMLLICKFLFSLRDLML